MSVLDEVRSFDINDCTTRYFLFTQYYQYDIVDINDRDLFTKNIPITRMVSMGICMAYCSLVTIHHVFCYVSQNHVESSTQTTE